MLSLERLGQSLSHTLDWLLKIGVGGHLGCAVVQSSNVGFVCRMNGKDALPHSNSTERWCGGGVGRIVSLWFDKSHGNGDVVPEVENVLVVGDQEIRRSPEPVQKCPSHQLSEQEGAEGLAVEQLLGVCGPNRAGALEFQWAAVAVGHQEAGDEGLVIGFQRGQEADSEGAGIDSRAIHRIDVRGAGQLGVWQATYSLSAVGIGHLSGSEELDGRYNSVIDQ